MAALQMLVVWAKGPPSDSDVTAVAWALRGARAVFDPIKLGLDVWGQVNRGEDGPLPSSIGYTDAQDYCDADSAPGEDVARIRDRYLDANRRLDAPVYVLFIVPPGQLHNANGFSLVGGYCSVLPVPTGVAGTADGRTYAHEIGHGLSLDHVDDKKNLMYPYRVVAKSLKLAGHDIEVPQGVEIVRFLKQHRSLIEA